MSRYVLVHGSWHGRWVWDRVSAYLLARGHGVEAPDLAGRGRAARRTADVTLTDHVDIVSEVVTSSDRPSILVGHSFGGFVISHVAERLPDRVELLVYLAAFLLRDGETVLGVARSVPAAVPHLDVHEDTGLITVRSEAAREVFYEDCLTEDADRATALLVPEALAPRRSPAQLSAERFGRVPRVYMETLNDRALPIELQRRMEADLPCREVVSLESGHSPFLSMPRTLAGHLADVAMRVEGTPTTSGRGSPVP